MSQVTERRHGNGSWSIDLRDDTPADLRRQLHLTAGDPTTKGFALLVITDQRVDPAEYPPPVDYANDPHPLLAAARYTGVVTDTANRRTQLSGEGLLALLGDSTGAGFYIGDLADKQVDAAASTLITRILDGGTLPDEFGGPDATFTASPLRAGTIHTYAGTYRIGDVVHTARQWLLDVSWWAGRRSFRIRPTGEVDWGTRAQLWGTQPRCIIGHGLPAGDDPRWITVRTTGTWSETVLGWAEQAIVDAGPTAGGEVLGPGPRYAPAAIAGDSYWNAIRVAPLRHQISVTIEDDEEIADWRSRAEDALATGVNTATVAANDLTGEISDRTHLEPGEPVWVWDPEAGLHDPTGPGVTYAGELIHPIESPLVATTWPVVDGMGVYLLYVDTTFGFGHRILDLTDHVQFASDHAAQLEIGAPAPTL